MFWEKSGTPAHDDLNNTNILQVSTVTSHHEYTAERSYRLSLSAGGRSELVRIIFSYLPVLLLLGLYLSENAINSLDYNCLAIYIIK